MVVIKSSRPTSGFHYGIPTILDYSPMGWDRGRDHLFSCLKDQPLYLVRFFRQSKSGKIISSSCITE